MAGGVDTLGSNLLHASLELVFKVKPTRYDSILHHGNEVNVGA